MNKLFCVFAVQDKVCDLIAIFYDINLLSCNMQLLLNFNKINTAASGHICAPCAAGKLGPEYCVSYLVLFGQASVE